MVSSGDTDLLTRLSRYHEWCDAYRVAPLPECQVCFRIPTSRLKILQCKSSDLLAVMQILLHDSYIHTLDLSNVKIGDAGAIVIADSVSGGCPLRNIHLANCGIGEQGSVALFKAASKNMHLRRLNLSSNFLGLDGCTALAYVLQRTQYLSEVDVRSCALGSAGLREISRALLGRAAAQESRWMTGSVVQNESTPTGLKKHASTSPGGNSVNQQVQLGKSSWAWLLGGGVIAKGDRIVITTAAQVKLLGAREMESPPLNTRMTRRDSTAEADNVGLDLVVLIGGNLVGLEVIASVIHAVGLFLTVLGAFYLLEKGRRSENTVELLSYIVYLMGLGGWFSTALLRHSLFQLSNSFFEQLSPPAAFALIASTYTPFLLNSFACVRGSWTLLGVQWTIGAFGSALASFTHSETSRRVLLVIYLLEGYSGALLGILLPSCLPSGAWALLISGGILFSMGIFFYARERPVGGISRGISTWYAVIIVAAILHFLSVFWYVAQPTNLCFEAAARLGLATGPEPPFLPSTLASWDAVELIREVLADSSARFKSVSNAGRRLVTERLVEFLKDLLKQLDKEL